MVLEKEKEEMRTRVKNRLKAAAPEDLEQQSREVCKILLHTPCVQEAARVVCYLASKRLREVETGKLVDELLSRGARLYIPKVRDKSGNMVMLHCASLEGLQAMPPFAIMEPGDTYEDGDPREDVIRDKVIPDVVIMPGLAFDKAGGRLGRGVGYYDKFLAKLEEVVKWSGQKMPILLGIAFKEQIEDAVPMAPHDRRCNALVTPDGIDWFSKMHVDGTK
jgi:5-formyltetrahydrofolate cyclo-ligase